LAGSMNNVFQLSSGETSVIEDIANNGGATLAANGISSSCTDPTLYNLPPNRYCGYAKTQCVARFGCIWSNKKKCEVVRNCDYPTQAFCLMDPTNCVYVNGSCQPKAAG
jgi:hypothetical protein